MYLCWRALWDIPSLHTSYSVLFILCCFACAGICRSGDVWPAVTPLSRAKVKLFLFYRNVLLSHDLQLWLHVALATGVTNVNFSKLCSTCWAAICCLALRLTKLCFNQHVSNLLWKETSWSPRLCLHVIWFFFDPSLPSSLFFSLFSRAPLPLQIFSHSHPGWSHMCLLVSLVETVRREENEIIDVKTKPVVMC